MLLRDSADAQAWVTTATQGSSDEVGVVLAHGNGVVRVVRDRKASRDCVRPLQPGLESREEKFNGRRQLGELSLEISSDV
jgi:hypothetical protein